MSNLGKNWMWVRNGLISFNSLRIWHVECCYVVMLKCCNVVILYGCDVEMVLGEHTCLRAPSQPYWGYVWINDVSIKI